MNRIDMYSYVFLIKLRCIITISLKKSSFVIINIKKILSILHKLVTVGRS